MDIPLFFWLRGVMIIQLELLLYINMIGFLLWDGGDSYRTRRRRETRPHKTKKKVTEEDFLPPPRVPEKKKN